MSSSRVLVAVLAVVILMSSALAATAGGFTDVRGIWGETEITQLADSQVVTGFQDGTFRPFSPISRAEFATFLARAKGWPVPTGAQIIYTDVESGKWYSAYVKAAVQQNALKGEGNRFRPQANITLAEAVAAVVRARCSDEEIASIQNSEACLAKFRDADKTPAWARRYFAAAIKNGIYPLKEKTDRLYASSPATRAEVAVLIYRVGPNGQEVATQVTEVKGSEPADQSPYTGLVVDARGLKLARSMSPRIVNEFAATVWDLGVRDVKVFNANTYYGFVENLGDDGKDYVLDHGICSYAKDTGDPCVKARCGDNPLVVRGIRRTHSADDWVVISREDGKTIEAADKAGNFRKGFKVAILLEK